MESRRTKGKPALTKPGAPRQLWRILVAVAGGALLALATPGAAVAQNFCCVCTPSTPECSGSGCVSNCGMVADSAACDAFCANLCVVSGGCVEFDISCEGSGNGCGAGAGRVCDPFSAGYCCDPNVPGSNCAPDDTPTATPTDTPTSTATATATDTATATATATGTSTSTDTPTPIPQGGGCTTASQCATDFCVDDVCCATASCPAGQSCANPGNAGLCAADPAAPAPAATSGGLLVMLGVLVGAAFVALRMRRA